MRDNAVLSFFPTVNHEWVLWMPSGFYETSIAGDTDFLGWHRNRKGAKVHIHWDPSRFEKMKVFEEELRRPNALEFLLNTADVDGAIARARGLDDPIKPPKPEPPKLVFPPVVRIVDPPPREGSQLKNLVGLLKLTAEITTEGSSGLRSLDVRNDTKSYPHYPITFDKPRKLYTLKEDLKLERGANVIPRPGKRTATTRNKKRRFRSTILKTR